MQGHPEDFISRSSHKVLYKIMQDCISLGSPQGLLTGTGTRSCKDFLDDFSRISTRSSDLCKGGFRPDPHKIFAYGAVLDNARTSWREANQDLHKIFSQGPVQDHAGSPQDLLKDLHESPFYYTHVLCEPALGQCRRTILCENSRGIMPRPRTVTTVLREPAQSKCTWTSQKSRFMR